MNSSNYHLVSSCSERERRSLMHPEVANALWIRGADETTLKRFSSFFVARILFFFLSFFILLFFFFLLHIPHFLEQEKRWKSKRGKGWSCCLFFFFFFFLSGRAINAPLVSVLLHQWDLSNASCTEKEAPGKKERNKRIEKDGTMKTSRTLELKSC